MTHAAHRIRNSRALAACLLLSVCGILTANPFAPSEKGDARKQGYHQLTLPTGENTEATLDLFIFTEDDYAFEIIDNRNFLGMRRYQRLAHAMKDSDYTAAVNASFFNVNEFTPVGQVISNGDVTGEFDREVWTRGVFYVDEAGPHLIDRDDYTPNDTVTQLIQSGPWLVQQGASLDDFGTNIRYAARTFIATDGQGNWALGVCDLSTLRELAVLLRSSEVTALINVQEALNLDGGPSTAFWCKREDGSTVSRSQSWATVNYLAIVRQSDDD